MSALRKEPTLTRQTGPWDDTQVVPAIIPAQPQPTVTTRVIEGDEEESWGDRSTLRKTFDILLIGSVILFFIAFGPGPTLAMFILFFTFIYLPFAVLRFFWRLLHWKQDKPRSTTIVENHYHYQ